MYFPDSPVSHVSQPPMNLIITPSSIDPICYSDLDNQSDLSHQDRAKVNDSPLVTAIEEILSRDIDSYSVNSNSNVSKAVGIFPPPVLGDSNLLYYGNFSNTGAIIKEDLVTWSVSSIESNPLNSVTVSEVCDQCSEVLSLVEAFERWCLETYEITTGVTPDNTATMQPDTLDFSGFPSSDSVRADFSGFIARHKPSAQEILQDVSNRIFQLRQAVTRNRQASRDRCSIARAERASDLTVGLVSATGSKLTTKEKVVTTSSSVQVSIQSPPRLRSRGPVPELPYIMSTPLEYKKR